MSQSGKKMSESGNEKSWGWACGSNFPTFCHFTTNLCHFSTATFRPIIRKVVNQKNTLPLCDFLLRALEVGVTFRLFATLRFPTNSWKVANQKNTLPLSCHFPTFQQLLLQSESGKPKSHFATLQLSMESLSSLSDFLPLSEFQQRL